ncbi:TIGR02453 family protein [Agromyces arachidis]|uniref:TIGR02453 family protein n=1 Tax=Agromyces arachidis TaxID=766966 RepID=UPI0040573769
MTDVEPGDPATGAMFSPRAFAFYAELAEHNDRDWFAAHRDEYESEVREPLERLAAWAQPRFGPAKVFRPNRDVRFSADKAPYKLNGAMTAGSPGGVYVSLSADGLVAGGGLYDPSREQLGRAREAIAEDGPAASRLAEILAGLDDEGFELATAPLRTAPRGYPRDHPRVELLRLTRYAALAHLPATATAAKIDRVWRTVQPLLDWARRYGARGT